MSEGTTPCWAGPTFKHLSDSQVNHTRQRSSRRRGSSLDGLLVIRSLLLLLGLLLLLLTLRLLALSSGFGGLCWCFDLGGGSGLLLFGLLALLSGVGVRTASSSSLLLRLLLLHFDLALQRRHIVEIKVDEPVRLVGKECSSVVDSLEVLDVVKVSSD